MKKNMKFLSMIFAASMALLVSCSSDDNNDGGTGGDEGGSETVTILSDGAALPATITGTVKLESGNSYELTVASAVKSGGKLIIEEGVTIEAMDQDSEDQIYIIIEQGGLIDAQGTATNPIVMTSTTKASQAWGGIHICGYASINTTNNVGTATSLSEIGNAPYGGDDDTDNSGTLRYIRLEYTGSSLDTETESNGISFYGVGNGTTVEYIQAYKGADDGFEFFGGTVNVKYMVATDCEDDSFDWTQGWRGKGQFLVAIHTDASTVCDCLMECDNLSSNNAYTPNSHPTLANVTLVGKDYTKESDGETKDVNKGVTLRAGTYVNLYNAIIVGKTKSLHIDTANTATSLVDGTSNLDFIALSASALVIEDSAAAYTQAMFETNNVKQAYDSSDLTGYVGTIADFGKDLSADSFFTATDYAGAVPASADWTTGWTK